MCAPHQTPDQGQKDGDEDTVFPGLLRLGGPWKVLDSKEPDLPREALTPGSTGEGQHQLRSRTKHRARKLQL